MSKTVDDCVTLLNLVQEQKKELARLARENEMLRLQASRIASLNEELTELVRNRKIVNMAADYNKPPNELKYCLEAKGE